MRDEIDKILQGNERSGARLINLLEERDPRGTAMLKSLYPHTGNAFLVGITGPPGVGKSTLVSQMVRVLRLRDLRVGVLAVDPTSPYTGGALLGDRIRMQVHDDDPGVFIRSMATRGYPGGISRVTREAALVLDAMRYAVIIIETAGVGQQELDVAGCVHSTVVVSMPGMGDAVQAMKAGLAEIGDVWVVNKSDLPGAADLVLTLEAMLGLRSHGEEKWRPPVVSTVASEEQGVAALVEELFAHRRYLTESGLIGVRRSRSAFDLFRSLVAEMVGEKLLEETSEFIALREDLRRRAIDPYTAAEALMARLFPVQGSS